MGSILWRDTRRNRIEKIGDIVMAKLEVAKNSFPRIKPQLTREQHDEMWEALEGTRRSSQFVKVPREAFVTMMNDYPDLYDFWEKQCGTYVGDHDDE